MKLKKVFLLLLLLVIAETWMACCDCEAPKYYNYTHTGMVLLNLDNRGQNPVIASDYPIPKEAYGIRIILTTEATARQKPAFSFFIQSAYAFSCKCEAGTQYLPRDSVVNLRIFTLNDFDAEYPAGSEISDYFRILSSDHYTTVPGYLSQSGATFTYNEPREVLLNTMLLQPPVQKGNYRFRIEIELSDGRIFNKETDMIELR